MNEPNGATVRIRPELLDRLKQISGIRSDDAFARTIGVSRPTLARLKAGEEPSLRTVIGIMQAFGLGFGEVTVPVEVIADEVPEAVAS
jgi:DNA-binding phage protein